MIICPAQALATVVLTLEIATDMIALAGHLPPPTSSSCALLQQGFMLLRLRYYKHAVEPHHKLNIPDKENELSTFCDPVN